MLRCLIVLALALVLVVALSPAVRAYPTSLNFIPVADLMDAHSVRVELENDGYSRPFAGGADNLVLLEMGITPKLEAGVDLYNYSGGTDTVLNAKYQLFDETETRPALSVGALDIGEGYKPTYFVAAAKDLGECRLHLGAVGDRHTSNLAVGCEVPLIGESCFMLDYIGGDDGFVGAGVWVPMKSGTSFTVGCGFPHESSDSNLLYLNFGWEFSLAK